MVPIIFSEMEEAENSDGFDSCEETEAIKKDNAQTLKRNGNPFHDFNIDILEVEQEDQDLARKYFQKIYKICHSFNKNWEKNGRGLH